MAHAPEEEAEMVGIASALVINIGTLSREWIEVLGLARQAAALALALDYGCLVVVSGAIDLITEG